MFGRTRSFSNSNVHVALFLFVFLLLPLMVFVDSLWLAKHISYNQWLVNVSSLFAFVLMYSYSARTLRRLMLYGIPVAVAGECLFSLVLGMYEYRLHNVPLYVIIGHSLVFAAVYHLIRSDIFKNNKHLATGLWCLATLLSVGWLLLDNDLLGFLCFLGSSYIICKICKHPTTRNFYVCMYVFVAYLELLGTAAGSWAWPDTWFGKIEWMPSGNPPIGIGLFYFSFDLGCLWLYRNFHPAVWKKARRLQYLRRGEVAPARYNSL